MNRLDELKKMIRRRLVVLDGAMGTAIQAHDLTANDFGGEIYEGCNENLVITRPDVISEIHELYLDAGCDIVETNTFGATPLVLDEFGLGSQAEQINLIAAQLARRAADKFSTPDHPRFVAGSVGPTTKAMSVTGGVEFDELSSHFYIQCKALVAGGVDFLLFETCQDTRNVKAGLVAVERLRQELSKDIGVALSVTIEPMGTMLAGQSIESLFASVAHCDLVYLGLNCATGPEFMTDSIRSLAGLAHFPVGCVPNAGLPDENGCYLESPEMVARVLKRFADSGWINVIGGCCGTRPDHIAALAALAQEVAPRKVPPRAARSFISGIDFLEITDEMRPVIVGERTNVIGSKKFKTLICEELFEEASEIARAQVKSGAHIIDVCLANPDRDELADMTRFLTPVGKKIRAPLMIDSTDEEVIAKSLTYCQGKAIINSINLEDGEERYEKVIPLVHRFGAAVVVGTIDEDPIQGMGVTRERKLAIAERSHALLTEKYGIRSEDIYWDPLVFPCATGDAQYRGSAVETIEGIRLIKAKFPHTKTILGISNVSFGLPPAGREVLNTVFLYHCVKAGLDLAIVNSEKLERYAAIPEIERQLADDLLYDRGEDPVAAFVAHFRSKKPTVKRNTENLPLEDRLANYIIEGSKDGLNRDLEEAMKTKKPLEIINGPLMKGMDEVGRLFNANQLIVAEVLQSAESMKAAVAFLEPYMEKSDSASRGTVLLATVKGDVHDIGKNLVEIILANNGFKVINLGIKIPPERLIAAIREHRPHIVGLSGLLVKSAQQMVVTADDMSRAGTMPPMMVGGAALSESFVDKNIARAYGGTVVYASDAMSGLDLAKRIVDPDGFGRLQHEVGERRKKLTAVVEKAAPAPESRLRCKSIERIAQLPEVSDWSRHVLLKTPIDEIWHFINPMMLYGRHLGMRGPVIRRLGQMTAAEMQEWEKADPKAHAIYRSVEEVKQRYRGSKIIRPAAVYRFFHCGSKENRLFIERDGKIFKVDLPRQRKDEGLCLADYVRETRTMTPDASELEDSIGLFVVTVGEGLRAEADELKARGDYLKSHILQALALESAEAYAEWLHSKIRAQWGFPDPLEITMLERFQAKYHGKRYSFGYPACPDLDSQAVLFDLLEPKDIGVELTEGFMMDPEASVSALAFHHPQASYFSVGVR